MQNLLFEKILLLTAFNLWGDYQVIGALEPDKVSGLDNSEGR